MNARKRIELEEEIIKHLKSKFERDMVGSTEFPSRLEREFVNSLTVKQLFDYRNLKRGDIVERGYHDEEVVRLVLDYISDFFLPKRFSSYIFFD